MITYKDCPECGARKIHSTVRLCEVCETCEKYESKIAGEAAHIQSLEGLLVDAARERDEARRDLGEILAVIHRDGGHHTGERGVSQSVADAHATWEAVVRERDEVAKERDHARQACNACWHDLERIVSLCERIADEDPLKIAERMMHERDEALAQVARREREHEALLETAQKALARVEAERDEARAEVERMRKVER